MTPRLRKLIPFLLLLGLPGCIVPVDPLRLAVEGAPSGESRRVTEPRLLPGETVALVVRTPGPDGQRLQACVLDALRSRLRADIPQPVVPDPDVAARLTARPGMPDQPQSLGFDWAIVIADETSQSSQTGGGVFITGIGAGRTTEYQLRVTANVLNLRVPVHVGSVWTAYHTQGSVLFVVSVIPPAPLPIAVLPAGTRGTTLCRDFSAALAGLLGRIAAAPPSAAPRP